MRSELCQRLDIDAVQSSREVVERLLTDMVDAAERLNDVLGEG